MRFKKLFCDGALFFLLICVIIYLMGLFTWGSLPKDQTSNQLISEAITEAIVAHEEDPTAHLGVGESLEQHKNNEIIDHPAGSVLPDKQDMTDFNIDVNFQSLDGFNTSGSANASALRLSLYVESPSINTSRAYFIPFQEDEYSEDSYSMLLQCVSWFSNGTLSDGIIEFSRLGFEVEHGRIRGYYWTDGFASQEYTAWYTVDMNSMKALRAQYFSLEGIARFYVEGDLIGELEYPFTPQVEDVIVDLKHTRNSEVDSYLYVSSLKVSLFEKQ